MASERRAPTRNAQPEEPGAPGEDGRGRRSRLEARRARQDQREELRRQQKTANRRRAWLPWIVGALVVVLGVAAFMLFVVLPQAAIIDGIERYTGLSRDHVQGPQDYPQTPPVGGAHSAIWYNCGIYDEPVPKEMGVHSLEHGAVWITYRPDLSADDVQKLRNLARGKDYVLLSPWTAEPPLPSPVVVSGWGVQLKADGAGDARVDAFVRKYANGPQTPEPGAVCRGGSGTPLQNP